MKKKLLKLELVHTLRTADNKVRDWLFVDELYKHSEEDKNYTVGINPPAVARPRRNCGCMNGT